MSAANFFAPLIGMAVGLIGAAGVGHLLGRRHGRSGR